MAADVVIADWVAPVGLLARRQLPAIVGRLLTDGVSVDAAAAASQLSLLPTKTLAADRVRSAAVWLRCQEGQWLSWTHAESYWLTATVLFACANEAVLGLPA